MQQPERPLQFAPFPFSKCVVQNGPEQSRARRFCAAKRTLEQVNHSELSIPFSPSTPALLITSPRKCNTRWGIPQHLFHRTGLDGPLVLLAATLSSCPAASSSPPESTFRETAPDHKGLQKIVAFQPHSDSLGVRGGQRCFCHRSVTTAGSNGVKMREIR